MKKLILPLFLMFSAHAGIVYAQSKRFNNLVWSDEFNKRNFIDPEKWTKVPRGNADWKDTMTDDECCYEVKKGKLVLKGIVNPNMDTDSVKHLTGGIWSKGKFNFQHGRLEIRVKTHNGTGAWPALWLLGENGTWPHNGEIDLMEQLNDDDFIYQTVHTNYTYNLKQTDYPKHSNTAKINLNKFNIIAIEKDENKITFFVNGKETHSYPRIETEKKGQWPYEQPFYIILSQQLEGDWVGKADNDDLPVTMWVDWVRLYQ